MAPLLLLLLVVLVRCCAGETERLLALPARQWPSEPSEAVPASTVVHCALLCLRRAADCPGADFDRPAGVCRLQSPTAPVELPQPGAAAGTVALQRSVSCRQLQRLGYRTDGVYQVPLLPVPLYCDMTRTLGGGWTLLVAARHMPSWSLDNVLERDSENPSISDDYSILRYGDRIKSVGSTPQFRYR